jgi:thioredoxin 1
MKQISENEFEAEVLKSEEKVLVDFYGETCGPCKVMASIIEGCESDLGVKVVKIDAFDNMDLAKQHGVTSIPRFFLYENGSILRDFAGVKNKDELKAWLNG